MFESRGRVIGQRVLSVENGIPKFEISIAGTGIFTGSLEVKTTWTYWAIQRPDRTSYSQGQGVIDNTTLSLPMMVETWQRQQAVQRGKWLSQER